jgi:hypothetical protein
MLQSILLIASAFAAEVGERFPATLMALLSASDKTMDLLTPDLSRTLSAAGHSNLLREDRLGEVADDLSKS